MFKPRQLLRSAGVLSGFLIWALIIIRHISLDAECNRSEAKAVNTRMRSDELEFNWIRALPSRHRGLFDYSEKFPLLPDRFRVIDIMKDEFPNDDRTSEGQGMKQPFNCTTTKSVPSFTICVYDPKEDRFISAAILGDGIWEPYITQAFERALNMYPSATVIDVGANIGYYSLFASSKGHTVIALEPQGGNQRRFVVGAKSQSRWSGERIILLGNALSDGHRNVSLSVNTDNQGGVRVLDECGGERGLLLSDLAKAMTGGGWGIRKGGGMMSKQCNIPTLTLDDLLHVISSSTAVIKVDIEGYECRAMRASRQFFSRIHVPYIFMEWRQMRERQFLQGTACSTNQIQELSITLADAGYVPHEIRSGIKLNPFNAANWQVGDVYWRRQNESLLVPSM